MAPNTAVFTGERGERGERGGRGGRGERGGSGELVQSAHV